MDNGRDLHNETHGTRNVWISGLTSAHNTCRDDGLSSSEVVEGGACLFVVGRISPVRNKTSRIKNCQFHVMILARITKCQFHVMILARIKTGGGVGDGEQDQVRPGEEGRAITCARFQSRTPILSKCISASRGINVFREE